MMYANRVLFEDSAVMHNAATINVYREDEGSVFSTGIISSVTAQVLSSTYRT